MFGSLVAVFVPRREPFRGPVLTAAEYNRPVIQDTDVHEFDERTPQSRIPCRPSIEQIAFYLSPQGYSFSDDFLMGAEKHVVPKTVGTPPGRMPPPPQRRNIARPVAIPYGSQIPEIDGIAPYGLE